MNKEINKAPSGRVRRQPVGTRNRLNVAGTEPGYEYRIVADRHGRLADFEAAGYEFVDADKVNVGDSRISQPKAQGAKATVHLGQGVQGYVMRQKKEWYDEDQAAKQASIKETQQSLRQVDKRDGSYGSVKFQEKE
jgi:hypothetical protein